METVNDRENMDASEEQGIGRVHGRLFGNWSHNIPQYIILWNRQNCVKHDRAPAAFYK